MIIYILYIITAIIIGFIVGFIMSRTLLKKRSFGNLRVDQSDKTDMPYLFLEVTNIKGLEHLKDGSPVILNTVIKDYIPQK